MSESKSWTLTVTDLNEYVDHSLRSDPILRSVRLTGEVSGFRPNASGHWYFTLKDEQSRIDCVLFRQNAMRMSFRPIDGEQVILHGYVTVYSAGGRYQFVADSMRPEGIGGLYQQFERLKAKLSAEGLFDSERKRPLPVRPKKIAIVTSETGAVWHDICHVAANRDPGIPIVLVPAAVQGAEAAASIVAAIRRASGIPGADVLIVARGGGSMEDLWCFNEESVARAIAACPIPVISAVGHETDFTIADFVADVRAATPSNASEIAVPDRSSTVRALQLMRRRFDACANDSVHNAALRVLRLRHRLEQNAPDHRLELAEDRLRLGRIELDRRMDAAMQLSALSVQKIQERLEAAADRKLQTVQHQLAVDRVHLQAVSPMRVLERGYAYVTDGTHPVTSAADAPDCMKIHFRDGQVDVRRE